MVGVDEGLLELDVLGSEEEELGSELEELGIELLLVLGTELEEELSVRSTHAVIVSIIAATRRKAANLFMFDLLCGVAQMK